jgi:hypothetical protein
VDEELVRIMVRQNASTLFFEDPDEQNRTKKAYPGVKLHGRLYYTRQIIPRMSQNIREAIIKDIGQSKFSITSDGWQKPSKFPALLRFNKI